MISNKELDLYPIDYPFETLVSRIENQKLILKPFFQRKYKWDKHGNEKCSKFIESCLMRIPLPACYFAEDQARNHFVIDGVQRLTTIQRFFKDEFSLKGLSFFTELNGKKFSQLGDFKTQLENTTIRCVILRKENPQEIIKEIFARLNQGSVILSPQEIRHAIYPGSLDSLLSELSSRKEVATFKAAKDGKGIPKDSREGDELVLRFFAFNSSLDDYNNISSSLYLDNYMQKNANVSPKEIKKMKELFNSTLDKCVKVFEDKAFTNLSKKKAIQSSTLWDLQMYSFVNYNLDSLVKNKRSIVSSFKKLCSLQEFSKTLTGQMLSKTNILKRRKMWNEELRKVVSNKKG